MTEKLQTLKCCGAPVNIQPDAEHKGVKGFGIYCETCDITAFNKDRDAAIEAYKAKMPGNKPMNNAPATTKAAPSGATPRNPNELAVAIRADNRIAEIMSPIISGDHSAMNRIITNNLRYVENAKQLEKVWTSPAGQQSIVAAVEEAMIMGAELGKMGDIVPYGDTCEFIPSVEAYVFSLTNGNNAPFDGIEIELIHENDSARISRKDGNFSIDLEMGIPRGDVSSVAVYGFSPRTGKVEGEVYDKERLMKKAEEHSSSYRYYIQDMRTFEALKGEGKTKSENGREYFIKKMFKRGGDSWDKKIYIDELTNPYAGADQPEMLRKMAGKSFLRKYQRVRNSEAAMEEVRTNEKTIDAALNMADSVLDV